MITNYKIKEIFLTLQGEGLNAGLPVVLVRFSGCNLDCDFCDTDFSGVDGPGGNIYSSPAQLADVIQGYWRSEYVFPNVLFTGGEPLLQLDQPLLEELDRRKFNILVETNGTIKAPGLIDWLCVSPKSEHSVQKKGQEIKIVWPQHGINPRNFEDQDFLYFWLQPKFDSNYQLNLKECIDYCLNNPKWRLSIQTHKEIGID